MVELIHLVLNTHRYCIALIRLHTGLVEIVDYNVVIFTIEKCLPLSFCMADMPRAGAGSRTYQLFDYNTRIKDPSYPGSLYMGTICLVFDVDRLPLYLSAYACSVVHRTNDRCTPTCCPQTGWNHTDSSVLSRTGQSYLRVTNR